MLHSSVRRVDYITGLVTILQDVVRYVTMQPTGVDSDRKDPPFQLVRIATDPHVKIEYPNPLWAH